MTDTTSDVPTSASEFDCHHLLDLAEVEVGDTVWLPASMIRGNKFRAVKVTIEERASVNNYEEIHAIDKWPHSDRVPTNHELAEGHNDE